MNTAFLLMAQYGGAAVIPIDAGDRLAPRRGDYCKAPPKPEFGSPCNGCGFCCAAEPCSGARQFVRGAIDSAPRLVMEFEAGRFWCGMVRRPGHYLGLPAWGDEEMGAMIGEALGTGKGCCADIG